MIDIKLHKTLQSGQGKMRLDLQFKIEKGQFVTLYGESGAGKTSTLRMLSGLLKPDQGSISVNGKEWLHTERKINLTPQNRSVGYVFQDYALFPNMTVLQNLEFALKKGQNKAIIEELISVTELEDFKHSKPQLLSGGQQQRVALARALVQQPEILLLDEPLSALDFKIREKLQNYILAVHKKYGLTTILVSHDKEEIIKLSDKIFELKQGKIILAESPSSFFKEICIPLKGEIITKQGKLLTVKIGDSIITTTSEEETLTVRDQVLIQFISNSTTIKKA